MLRHGDVTHLALKVDRCVSGMTVSLLDDDDGEQVARADGSTTPVTKDGKRTQAVQDSQG